MGETEPKRLFRPNRLISETVGGALPVLPTGSPRTATPRARNPPMKLAAGPDGHDADEVGRIEHDDDEHRRDVDRRREDPKDVERGESLLTLEDRRSERKGEEPRRHDQRDQRCSLDSPRLVQHHDREYCRLKGKRGRHLEDGEAEKGRSDLPRVAADPARCSRSPPGEAPSSRSECRRPRRR